MSRRARHALSVAVAVGLVATGCSAPPDPHHIALTVSRGGCGQSWRPPPGGGTVTFTIRNADIVTTDVDLVDPSTGAVYAEVEGLGPNTSRPLRVPLGRGAYAFRCVPEDDNAVIGPAVRVTTGSPAAAVRPVTGLDLFDTVNRYRDYVTAGLATLAGQVDALRSALHRGLWRLPPSSVAKIGQTDRANHEYDLTDFDASLKAGNLPAVSFVKASEYQDGHAAYSDPLDEQHFLVDTINKLQKSRDWASTAVVVAYDDSDGWYDHVTPKILNGSTDAAHDDPTLCGPSNAPKAAGGYLDRCGPGPRLPLLVISPYAKSNFVDHSRTEQTSILKFVEDNWRTGRVGDHAFDTRAGSLDGMFDFWHHPDTRPVLLDPATGGVVTH